MSEHAQKLWEQVHGKGNPSGGNQSEIEVAQNYALHCDDCDGEAGESEGDDRRTTCSACGCEYGPCCAERHRPALIGPDPCYVTPPRELEDDA